MSLSRERSVLHSETYPIILSKTSEKRREYHKEYYQKHKEEILKQ
jgi:hypothetical protein